MRRIYRLYIDGVAQNDCAHFTKRALQDAADVNLEHWPGHEWREEVERPQTPFTAQFLDGAEKHYEGHDAFGADWQALQRHVSHLAYLEYTKALIRSKAA